MFIINPQLNYFSVDDNIAVDTQRLKKKGCLFFSTELSMLSYVCNKLSLQMSEVENLTHVLSLKKNGKIVYMDLRGQNIPLEEPVERFILEKDG